uniref:26S proteasome non-ATPase regulatory subunit 5 n=1 Tax=Macrostomum lignano TaxID=282301 RepID=A0A1I8I688_9PLAT
MSETDNLCDRLKSLVLHGNNSNNADEAIVLYKQLVEMDRSQVRTCLDRIDLFDLAHCVEACLLNSTSADLSKSTLVDTLRDIGSLLLTSRPPLDPKGGSLSAKRQAEFLRALDGCKSIEARVFCVHRLTEAAEKTAQSDSDSEIAWNHGLLRCLANLLGEGEGDDDEGVSLAVSASKFWLAAASGGRSNGLDCRLLSGDLSNVFADRVCRRESPVVRMRGLELAARLAVRNPAALVAMETAGLLGRLVEDAVGTEGGSGIGSDPLLAVNCLEVLGLLAMCHHGLAWLQRSGLLFRLDRLLSPSGGDVIASLLRPQLMRLFGHVTAAAPNPDAVLSACPGFLASLQDGLASNSSTDQDAFVAMATVGHIGAGSVAGKSAALARPELVRPLAEILRRSPRSEPRARALAAIRDLLKVNGDWSAAERSEAATVAERLWSGPLSLRLAEIEKLARVPFPEIRLEAFGLLAAIAEQDWAASLIAAEPSLLEFLLDRRTESTHESAVSKFAVVEAACRCPGFASGVFSGPDQLRLRLHVKQGLYYAPAQANPSRPRQKLIAEKANNKDKDANIENQTTAKVAVSDTASPAAQMPSSDLHQSLDRQLSLELDSLSQQQNKSPGSVASGCYDNPAFRNSCLQLMTSSPSCNSPNIVGISRFSDAASSTVRASWSSGSAAVNSYSAATTMSSPPLPQLPQPSPTFPRADSTAAGNKSTGFWQGVLGCFRPMWTVLSVRMAATGRRAAESSQAPWMLDLMDILDLQFLASGTQGSVFLGVLNGQQVAMKKFNEPPDVELRELRHLASLRHPNVVRFIGCIDSNISLVMEFCQHGNLFDYYNNPANCISAARVADWAKQLADGMAYLHCSRIVHGDLKSPNILLCELDTLKISDFGLVRLPGEADQRQQQQQQQQLYGTVRWMSPEQCRQEMWSYPADVFSYGVILWEMLFQEVPYRSVDPWAVVLGVGQGTLSLPLPRHTPGIMRTLMEACWACKPKQRPAFRNIGRSLEASLLDLLLLSDGDLRILRKAWSAEIARQLSCMRQEDFKAKLEADLIRKRKEELQHAQEIRQHYEKRLHRVDDLQMDLTNLRMQLQLQARAERDRSAKLRAIIRRRCCRACQQSLRAVCSRQQLSAAVVLDQPLLDATNAHTAVAVAAAASMATDSSTKTLPQSSSTEQAPSMSPDLGDRGGRPRRANRRLSKALTLPAGGVAAAAALFRRGGAPPPPPPSQPSA